MVERILEQEAAIRVVLSSDRKASHLIPTWQDMEVLKAINDTLSPLADFTDVMSGETYVTSSAILPIINLLTTSVLKENDEETPLTNDIRATILADLLGRNNSDDTVHLLEVASFLDPRFKSKFVKDDHVDAVKETVFTDAVALYMPSHENSTPGSSPPRKKKHTLGSLLKSNVDVENSESPEISPEQKIRSEVQKFLSKTKLNEEDPLRWWRTRETDYPLLARVIKKYLCIPATSTSSERLFSRSGQIVTPLRNCLSPQTVQI